MQSSTDSMGHVPSLLEVKNGSMSPTLKLFLNVSDFNTHGDDSPALRLLGSLGSFPPMVLSSTLLSHSHKGPNMDHFQYLATPLISISFNPASDNHLYLYSILPLQLQIYPSFDNRIHWSSRLYFCLPHWTFPHSFCYWAEASGSIIIITSLPLPLNHCAHFVKPQLQLFKCNTQLTLVPLLMNMNMPRGQLKTLQNGLMLNSWVASLMLLVVTLYFPGHLLFYSPRSYHTSSSLSSHLWHLLPNLTPCWSPSFQFTQTTEASRREHPQLTTPLVYFTYSCLLVKILASLANKTIIQQVYCFKKISKQVYERKCSPKLLWLCGTLLLKVCDRKCEWKTKSQDP